MLGENSVITHPHTDRRSGLVLLSTKYFWSIANNEVDGDSHSNKKQPK